MSYYVPPHLRNKRRRNGPKRLKTNTFTNLVEQYPSGSVCMKKNERFSNMFDPFPKPKCESKPEPKLVEKKFVKIPKIQKIKKEPKKCVIELDCGRTRCVALYSKRHDRIFLMGSYANTNCITIDPETHEITKLRKLPYFKEKDFYDDELISPQTAWFDQNEENIFVLNRTTKYSPRVLKYNIKTNRFRDVELFDKIVRQTGTFYKGTVVRFDYKNKYNVQLLGTLVFHSWNTLDNKSKIYDQLILDHSSNKFTLNTLGWGNGSINDKAVCFSSRTKKLYQFGWRSYSIKTNEEENDAKDENDQNDENDENDQDDENEENDENDENVEEIEQFEVDILSLGKNEVKTIVGPPDLDYLKDLDNYGFCEINGRYCLFIGGGNFQEIKDEIYIFDTVDCHWSKSPIKLKEKAKNASCVWDNKRKIIHIFGGRLENYTSTRSYMKLKAFEVIPNYMDFDLVRIILWFWFENSKSKSKVKGRWNQDISCLVLSYA